MYLVYYLILFVEIFLLVAPSCSHQNYQIIELVIVHFVLNVNFAENSHRFSPPDSNARYHPWNIYFSTAGTTRRKRRLSYTCDADKLGQCWHAAQSTVCVTGFAVGKTRDDTDRETLIASDDPPPVATSPTTFPFSFFQSIWQIVDRLLCDPEFGNLSNLWDDYWSTRNTVFFSN